jgi:hypothetical protein
MVLCVWFPETMSKSADGHLEGIEKVQQGSHVLSMQNGTFTVPTRYVRQRFWQALQSLVGSGSIQYRLEGAANALIYLRSDELPECVRSEFEAILHALTKYPAEREGEGSIGASTRKLTPKNRAKIADRILSIYIDMYGGL